VGRNQRYQLFLVHKYHHPKIGKIFKFFAVTYGEKYGKIQILNKMEGVDNYNMELIFMEDQIKGIRGRVFNVKEKITITINHLLRKK
jgi:hypothetical protein